MRTIKRRKQRKKNIAAAICILAAIVVLVVCFYNTVIKSRLDLVNYTELSEDDILVNDLSDETLKVLEDYTTIALFGLDNRDQGNYNRGNSDMIMLLAINNKTKEVQFVSVYRDSYLNIQGEQQTFRKANAAYAYGGAAQAISMLNTNMDLDIDAYVTFDFQTVADAIDALGGVEVEIEDEEELDYLNYYIDHTNGILGTDAGYVEGTGTQTLSGVQAVAYSRIRYTSGYDYKRASRQRLVLTNMLAKAKKAGPFKLLNIMDTVLPQIETNLTESEVIKLAFSVIRADLTSSSGWPYQRLSANLGDSAGWVDIACDLKTNVSEFHELFYGQEDYTPTDTVLSYDSQIISSTGYTAEDAAIDGFEEEDDFQ